MYAGATAIFIFYFIVVEKVCRGNGGAERGLFLSCQAHLVGVPLVCFHYPPMCVCVRERERAREREREKERERERERERCV